MDNLAHTLAGAALGQAGLKKQTGLGMATLMIAANLPDIDGVTMFIDRGSLYFRRGWTHGPIALVILPILLALAMRAFDRWQTRRGTRPPSREPVRLKGLLILAYIGVISHPLMDFLNTYGVRCLMPFSERWFYGDALFIIDLWLWSALGIGVWLSRRKERWTGIAHPRPALIAVVAVIAYAGAMGIASTWVEAYTARTVQQQGMGTPDRCCQPCPAQSVPPGRGVQSWQKLRLWRLWLGPGAAPRARSRTRAHEYGRSRNSAGRGP